MLLLKIQYRNMFFNAPVCMCAAYEIHKLQSRVLQTHFLQWYIFTHRLFLPTGRSCNIGHITKQIKMNMDIWIYIQIKESKMDFIFTSGFTKISVKASLWHTGLDWYMLLFFLLIPDPGWWLNVDQTAYIWVFDEHFKCVVLQQFIHLCAQCCVYLIKSWEMY